MGSKLSMLFLLIKGILVVKLIRRTCLAMLPLLLFMWRNAFRSKLVRKTVEIRSIHNFRPFHLLFIADIHRRKLSGEQFNLPIDCIIIGGDLTEQGVPLRRIEHNLKVLSSRAQVYFIWGNNDRETDEYKLRKIFDRYGIIVMDNESIPLFGEPHLKLAGSDHFLYDPEGLSQTFSEVKPEDTVIFVSHTPFVFARVRENYPVDLMLAGHTHGGQIRLGKLGVFKKGAFQVKEGVPQLITNGFGTTTLPLRLGAEAEFHLLLIKPLKRRDFPGWQNSR